MEAEVLNWMIIGFIASVWGATLIAMVVLAIWASKQEPS